MMRPGVAWGIFTTDYTGGGGWGSGARSLREDGSGEFLPRITRISRMGGGWSLGPRGGYTGSGFFYDGLHGFFGLHGWMEWGPGARSGRQGRSGGFLPRICADYADCTDEERRVARTAERGRGSRLRAMSGEALARIAL